MNTKETFQKKSTFDLAFGLAMGKYEENEKLIVLDVIRERGDNSTQSNDGKEIVQTVKPKTFKKGSKSAKSYQSACKAV